MTEPTLAATPPDDVRARMAYRLIERHYGDRRAERSQVPLINHIHEGYQILKRIKAPFQAIEAYFIHPLLQADDDLRQNLLHIVSAGSNVGATYSMDPTVLILAMEYRNIANAFLSDKVYEAEYSRGNYEICLHGKPKLSPLSQVNAMLVADKVQNRKDFLLYHKDTHARSRELDHYFNLWMEALEITEDRYQELIAGL